MVRLITFFVGFSALLGTQLCSAHTYGLGSCPAVDPLPDFNMNRMLGIWYVIQKTSTASTCITYNFTRTNEPYEYSLEQVSQHFILGLTPLRHRYQYTGKLTVPDPSVPAKMSVRFPLNVAGSSSFTIFMSDYDNYAAIFTCQRITFAHRQSATILSRHKTLDKLYVDKVRTRLSSYNIDPFDLSIISQSNCPDVFDESGGFNINIDSDTISAKTAADLVRAAGEAVGDGIEYVSGGVRNVYNAYSGTNRTGAIPEGFERTYNQFSHGVSEGVEGFADGARRTYDEARNRVGDAWDTYNNRNGGREHSPNRDVEMFNERDHTTPVYVRF